MLQNYAATHNVKMITLSIGGNDFNFASIVQTCVTDWLISPSWWKDYCNDDSSVTSELHVGERQRADERDQERDPQHRAPR